MWLKYWLRGITFIYHRPDQISIIRTPPRKRCGITERVMPHLFLFHVTLTFLVAESLFFYHRNKKNLDDAWDRAPRMADVVIRFRITSTRENRSRIINFRYYECIKRRRPGDLGGRDGRWVSVSICRGLKPPESHMTTHPYPRPRDSGGWQVAPILRTDGCDGCNET